MKDVLTWPDDHPKAKILARSRARILAAARRLFLDQGFDRTGMEAVAAGADVGLMTLYRHFRTKETLFRAVMEAECGMRGRLSGPADIWSLPPDAALAAFGRAAVATLLEPDQLALRRLAIAEAGRFPELGRIWRETGPALGVAEVSAYVADLARDGRLRIDDPDAFAEAFLALLDRLPQRGLLGCGPITTDAIEADVARAVSLVLAAASPGDDQAAGEHASAGNDAASAAHDLGFGSADR
jgi:TetR/AcrR family transcriptional regulator, mexJK operon transcriptional repressor